MSGKKNLPPFVMASNADLSADFISTPTVIATVDRVQMVIQVTGTPTGTIAVQSSIDYQSPNVPGAWFDIPLGLTPLIGADQDYMIDFTETGMKALRVKYTRAAGTGVMNSTIFGKES